MGMETHTGFRVDKSKCIQCGKCLNTCSDCEYVEKQVA